MKESLVDTRAVQIRLGQIDDRLQALRSIQQHGREAYLEDRTLQAAAERHFQLALQAAIDVALHIAAEDLSRTPEDYASAFQFLADAGVLMESVAAALMRGTKLRNILVHAYLDVDQERMWDNLHGLEDLEAFVQAIEQYVSGTK